MMDENWQDVLQLNERDFDVIEVIDIEDLSCFTFEGLKRRLKIHPETLSRTLNRLVEDGVIKKVDKGYCLTDKGKQLLKNLSNPEGGTEVPVLHSFLPPDFEVSKLVGDLEGKWFGSLRWLGYNESKDNVTLKWITTDGEVVVSVVLTGGAFYVSSKSISDVDVSLAINVAYQLMGHVTKLISKVDHN
jgi:predicted transcriptional regulator